MDANNNMEKEESAIAKKVNKNLVFNVNSSNTDRPVNPIVENNKSLSGKSLSEERAENDVFPSVTAHSLLSFRRLKLMKHFQTNNLT